ncbi:MAG: hypothetical protein WC648_04220, partial [Candidatus Paceibacterota bacterium]
MLASIKLFKGLIVVSHEQKQRNDFLMAKTIKKGFIFSEKVIANYPEKELVKMISKISKEIIQSKEANNSFHKSWKKIEEADLSQLVAEQIIHYFSTYGMESLGLYNKECVYIPTEKLQIPKIDIDTIPLLVIQGFTGGELKAKVLTLLGGIALKPETMGHILEGWNVWACQEDQIKNHEFKILLYDKFDIVPQNNIEFLRYLIYKTTQTTLLIKSQDLCDKIKTSPNKGILTLFKKYGESQG